MVSTTVDLAQNRDRELYTKLHNRLDSLKKKLEGPVVQQLSGERAVVAGNVMIVT